MRRTSWMLGGALCASLAMAEPAPEVKVEPRPDRRETDYRLESDGCRITWSVAHAPPNEGIVQYRADCLLPLAEQMSRNAKIADVVFRSEMKLHSLFLGGLGSIPEASFRLATAAQQASAWNVRTGKPKAGSINLLVAELVRKGVLKEWETMLQAHGVKSRVSGIEKVLVEPAQKLPFFIRLHEQGAKPADRLPYSCLVWLSLSPEQQPSPP